MTEQLMPVTGPPAFEPDHPGVILREEFLEPARVGVKEAAEELGVSRQALHRVLAGSAAVSAEMALRLSRFTETSPTYWLNLQAQHDLWHSERAMRAELRAIGKVGAIGPTKASRAIAASRKTEAAANTFRAIAESPKPRARRRSALGKRRGK